MAILLHRAPLPVVKLLRLWIQFSWLVAILTFTGTKRKMSSVTLAKLSISDSEILLSLFCVFLFILFYAATYSRHSAVVHWSASLASIKMMKDASRLPAVPGKRNSCSMKAALRLSGPLEGFAQWRGSARFFFVLFLFPEKIDTGVNRANEGSSRFFAPTLPRSRTAELRLTHFSIFE